MAVDDLHEDYEANVGRWLLVDKVCEERDLPELIHDLDVFDATKNRKFKTRASFFGATGFTESGLIGIAYRDEPDIDLPAPLEYLLDNADGTGINFANHLLASTSQVLRKGRLGLFVTYPERPQGTSLADREAGEALATIHAINAERIINWWYIKRGANSILGGVVFKDRMTTREGFDAETEDILRSLTLEEGFMVDRKWRKPEGKAEWEVIPGTEFQPTNGRGQRWPELPFIFCGSMSNTWHVDPAPLYSLAKKNADHLNNSAINEEGIWFSGHIQPVADEMDAEVFDTLVQVQQSKGFNTGDGGGGFKIGAGQLIIAKGFRFEVAEPNSAARQGMLDKIDDMKAIGARILQPGGVAKTAQQDLGEQRVQHSVLSLAIVNIEDAYNTALRFVSEYMNTPEPSLSLSRSFMLPEVNPEMIDRLMSLFDRGLVGETEAFSVLSRAHILDDEKTVEEYSEEVRVRGVDDGATLDGDA